MEDQPSWSASAHFPRRSCFPKREAGAEGLPVLCLWTQSSPSAPQTQLGAALPGPGLEGHPDVHIKGEQIPLHPHFNNSVSALDTMNLQHASKCFQR